MSICAICTGRHDESDCPKGLVYVRQCRPWRIVSRSHGGRIAGIRVA